MALDGWCVVRREKLLTVGHFLPKPQVCTDQAAGPDGAALHRRPRQDADASDVTATAADGA